MADTEDEKAYWAEFERLGPTLVRDALNRGEFSHEPKRQSAFRWLSKEDREQASRERRIYRVACWTLAAAIAGVAVGIIGIIATLWH